MLEIIAPLLCYIIPVGAYFVLDWWLKRRRRKISWKAFCRDERTRLRDERTRLLSRKEAQNFYMWAVIHDGIAVPIGDDTKLNEYQKWERRVDRARLLLTR